MRALRSVLLAAGIVLAASAAPATAASTLGAPGAGDPFFPFAGSSRSAEQVSGQDLDAFFDEWLYRPGKPAGLA